jgi:hypothetical protein
VNIHLINTLVTTSTALLIELQPVRFSYDTGIDKSIFFNEVFSFNTSLLGAETAEIMQLVDKIAE